MNHLKIIFLCPIISLFHFISESWAKLTIASIGRENMYGLSTDTICSKMRRVFRERSLIKTLSFEKQVMSKHKYPYIFLRKVEAIVFIILQIFSKTS